MESSFFPAHRSDKCPSGWHITKTLIGSGGSGTTYKSCCETQCDYVVKIQHYDPSLRTEIDMQNLAADIGVSIPVIDSWIEDGYLFMVMPALKHTMKEI